MSFWTFLSATTLGKGFVKVTLQASVCILGFREATFKAIAAAVSKLDVLSLSPKLFNNMTLYEKACDVRELGMYKFSLQARACACMMWACHTL